MCVLSSFGSSTKCDLKEEVAYFVAVSVKVCAVFRHADMPTCYCLIHQRYCCIYC